MEELTASICWELVKKEGYIAIWRKPLNNSCYLNRSTEVQPPLCDSNDNPDNVWYALTVQLLSSDILHVLKIICVDCREIGQRWLTTIAVGSLSCRPR